MRNRVLHFICDHIKNILTDIDSQPVRYFVNQLMKYALKESSIGEWERLVTALYHINIGKNHTNHLTTRINLPSDVVVNILCYPYTEQICQTVRDKVSNFSSSPFPSFPPSISPHTRNRMNS